MAFADPVAVWHSEHVYFNRLLDLLQREVECVRRDRDPHYQTMFDIVEYLQVYAERYHHRREDAAAALLVRRQPHLARLIERLRHEHVALAVLGERLGQYLNEMIEGFTVSLDDLVALATTFLLLYRDHIAEEEAEIVPAASALTEEEWQTVAQAVPETFDPLFGAKPEQRYHELRRSLSL